MLKLRRRTCQMIHLQKKHLLKFWNIFVTKLETDGKYNLAAILQIDTPKLINEHTIRLEFPNTTNKIEVERQQFDLLQYLRKSVNNFSIASRYYSQ